MLSSAMAVHLRERFLMSKRTEDKVVLSGGGSREALVFLPAVV